MNISQLSKTNVSSQLNMMAVKNVEIANTLVNIAKINTGVNKSALENAASKIVGAANTVALNASNAKSSTEVVNVIASTANVLNGANKVLNAVVNKAAQNQTQAVNNSIKANTKAVNSALSLVNKVNNAKTEDALVNAAAKVHKNTNKMIMK